MATRIFCYIDETIYKTKRTTTPEYYFTEEGRWATRWDCPGKWSLELKKNEYESTLEVPKQSQQYHHQQNLLLGSKLEPPSSSWTIAKTFRHSREADMLDNVDIFYALVSVYLLFIWILYLLAVPRRRVQVDAEVDPEHYNYQTNTELDDEKRVFVERDTRKPVFSTVAVSDWDSKSSTVKSTLIDIEGVVALPIQHQNITTSSIFYNPTDLMTSMTTTTTRKNVIHHLCQRIYHRCARLISSTRHLFRAALAETNPSISDKLYNTTTQYDDRPKIKPLFKFALGCTIFFLSIILWILTFIQMLIVFCKTMDPDITLETTNIQTVFFSKNRENRLPVIGVCVVHMMTCLIIIPAFTCVLALRNDLRGNYWRQNLMHGTFLFEVLVYYIPIPTAIFGCLWAVFSAMMVVVLAGLLVVLHLCDIAEKIILQVFLSCHSVGLIDLEEENGIINFCGVRFVRAGEHGFERTG